MSAHPITRHEKHDERSLPLQEVCKTVLSEELVFDLQLIDVYKNSQENFFIALEDRYHIFTIIKFRKKKIRSFVFVSALLIIIVYYLLMSPNLNEVKLLLDLVAKAFP